MKTSNNSPTLKYQMIVQWSDENEAYLVSFPEFPQQKWRTHGDSYEEAVAMGKEVLEELVAVYQDQNKPLPEPYTVEKISAST